MRFRKLASTTAGALVLGALSVPMTMTAAHAAPVWAEASYDAVCSYNNFKVPVKGTLAVKVDGTTVDATIDAVASLGAGGITVSKLVSEVVLDVDGAAVTVKGEKVYAPPVKGDTPLPIPAMTGTRTATANPVKFDLTSSKLDFTIFGAVGSAPCTVVDFAPVNFSAKTKACRDAEAALPVAQTNVTKATNDASAASANVAPANAKAATAGAAVNEASATANSASATAKKAATTAKKAAAAVKKAAKSVSKAKKAVKKAKTKAKKAKAKKAMTKAKKNATKSKKAKSKATSALNSANRAAAAANAALSAANAQLQAAQAQAAAAQAASVKAESNLTAAKAAVTAAQAAVTTNC